MYYFEHEGNRYGVDGIIEPTYTNEEVSAAEVKWFMESKPDRHFVYVNRKKRVITTWIGEVLGTCEFGRRYQGNFGDMRVPVRVKGINGVEYHGTYFEGAGDYARIRKVKGG